MKVKLNKKERKVYNTLKKELVVSIGADEVDASNAAVLSNKLSQLANGEQLEEKYRDHDLSGDWKGHRECHIQPDWLLVYRIEDDVLILTLSRTGTHSDLFGK